MKFSFLKSILRVASYLHKLSFLLYNRDALQKDLSRLFRLGPIRQVVN